jgi:hypothetical protein
MAGRSHDQSGRSVRQCFRVAIQVGDIEVRSLVRGEVSLLREAGEFQIFRARRAGSFGQDPGQRFPTMLHRSINARARRRFDCIHIFPFLRSAFFRILALVSAPLRFSDLIRFS